MDTIAITDVTALRLRLRAAGYAPIPVHGKAPAPVGWQTKSDISDGEIALWSKLYPAATNTGILTQLTPALDIDILDPDAAEAVENLVRDRFGDAGAILVRIGRAPKRAIPFRTNVPFRKIAASLIAPNGDASQKLELLADGQQIVAAGVHPDTGRPYRWFGGDLEAITRDELPELDEAAARRLVEDAAALLIEAHGYSWPPERPSKGNGAGTDDAGDGAAGWAPLIDNILRGCELHDSTRDLTASLVAAGTGAGAAVNLTRALLEVSPAPHDARWPQRYGDIPRLVDGLEGKSQQQPVLNIRATPFVWRDPRTIPRRGFLYGHHLVRKFLSATFAPSGVGKSNQLLVEALAMASGRNLLGVWPKQRCRVWYWNGEDPREEIERRVAAACLHYHITAGELDGWLYIDSGRELEIVIAEENRSGTRIAEPVVDALIAEIRARSIDVMMVDPFVSSHRVTENDNNAIDAVVKKWNMIADATDCAIGLSHHTRKTYGAEVTVEDGRGASAMLAACRAARTLNQMSEQEAENAGVARRRLYFRADDGETSMSAPADGADWYHIVSVNLDNGDPGNIADFGDSVGVVTKWQWPDLMAGMTAADFEKVAAVIRQGQWRADVQAKGWVGHAVAQALNLDITSKKDRAKIRTSLAVWLKAGTLAKVEGEDAKRMKRDFIIVTAPQP